MVEFFVIDFIVCDSSGQLTANEGEEIVSLGPELGEKGSSWKKDV